MFTRTHWKPLPKLLSRRFVKRSREIKTLNCINLSQLKSKSYFVFFSDLPVIHKDPCTPSPCGPNSICKVSNNQAVCTCQPEFLGTPPACRPECLVSSECSQQQACIRQKCKNPCVGVCGQNTECKVINHSPICTCRARFTGDPFNRCFDIPGSTNGTK